MSSRRWVPRSLGDALAVGFLRFARRAIVLVVLVSAAQWGGHLAQHRQGRTFEVTVVSPQP